MLANAMMVIIFQDISGSNQHVVHLKRTILYVNSISVKLEKYFFEKKIKITFPNNVYYLK